MTHLLLNLLFHSLPFLVCGVVALIRAAGSPGGRGLIFTAGGLLVLTGLLTGGRDVWYFSAGAGGSFSELMLFPEHPTLVLGFPPGAVPAYTIALAVLPAVALTLLLLAVLSARRHKHAAPAGNARRPAPAAGPSSASRRS